jgi:PAS domain S-box-containing protein
MKTCTRKRALWEKSGIGNMVGLLAAASITGRVTAEDYPVDYTAANFAAAASVLSLRIIKLAAECRRAVGRTLHGVQESTWAPLLRPAANERGDWALSGFLLVSAALVALILLLRFRRRQGEQAFLAEQIQGRAEEISGAIGDAFFRSLVQYLCFVSKGDCAFVAELSGHERFRTLALCVDGRIVSNVECEVGDTPCEKVIAFGQFSCPRGAQSRFPIEDAHAIEIHSYSGIALSDGAGRPVGLICVLGRTPISSLKTVEAILKRFETRVTDEIERQRAESALLRESMARNRAILKAMPDLMFVLDQEGTYVDYYARNPGELYAPPEHFLGKNMRDILPPEVSSVAAKKFDEASSTGEPATFEFNLPIKDTKYFYEARIVRCDDNTFLTIVRDITAAKRAESELQSAKRFIERVMDTLPNLLFVYDCSEHRHVYVNRGITTVLGYAEPEIRKMGEDVLPALVHPDDRHRLEAQFAELRAAVDGAVHHTVYRMRDNNGEWRWILGNETVLDRNDDGSVKRVIGTATDITEHRRIQEELQLLSTRLLNFQDEELRKLAAELHEVIAQNLFAVTLNLKRLRQFEGDSREPSHFEALLTECETLCERSLREIRSSSYSLHPPALHELGVIPTLRWYIEGFAKRSGIQVQLSITGDVKRLPLEMETYIFRVVQEGLTNVARHSRSPVAIVRVKGSASEIVFEIEHHGRGFDASTVAGQPNTELWPGLGLQEMRQRLRQFGGSLEIRPAEKGTLLVARVPIRGIETQSEVAAEVNTAVETLEHK